MLDEMDVAIAAQLLPSQCYLSLAESVANELEPFHALCDAKRVLLGLPHKLATDMCVSRMACME